MALRPPNALRRARLGIKVLSVLAVMTALAAFGPLQGSSAAADTQAAATTAASAPALTASASSVTEGTPVTFTYSTPSNYLSTSNWIGFYSGGNSPENGPYGIWEYTQTGTHSLPASGSSPVADGTDTFSTAGLAPGTYTVYFLYNDGYAVIGDPVTLQVTPAPNPDLSASASTVVSGSPVTFTYSTPSNFLSTSNWIGWYSAGETPGVQGSTIWDYTQTGTQSLPASGSSPVADGTLTFSTAGLAPGAYTVYFLYNNGYTIIGYPINIQVTPAPVAPGTLTPAETSATAGDQVSFGYTMPSADVNSGNKIAWFPSGADPVTGAPLYAFNQAAPAASGSDTFDTTGLASASYDVYLLTSGKSVIAGPVTIAVTNNGPQLPSPGQLPGQPNLIVNGGAEMGNATLNGTAATSVPGWTTTGALNEVQYDAAGGYPAFSSPGSADRGQNFFAGGAGGVSTGTQTVDVSNAEGQINQGNVKFNLGGWLGGTGSAADDATVTATFRSADGSSLGTATLGPVTPAMRKDTTELLPENAAGTLPKQTKSVQVALTVNGSQGYADNLSFTISSDAVPAPALPALPAPETPAPAKTSGDPNLIVNGGAEIGDGSFDGIAANTLPGWTVTGLMNEVQYGASDGQGVGGWPTPSTPGPADRGSNFFGGGGGGVSTATQTIDVSKAEGDINQGNVSYDLSGWLGGTGSVTDTATVTATFLDAAGDSLGTTTLGPVTPAMRNDVTEFLPEDATGTLPPQTKSVRIVLTVNGNHPANRNGHGQGYADNLSFTISSAAVPAPALPTQPAATVPHYDHVFVVMMENEDYADVIGNTAQAPYINSLLSQGANLTSMYGLSHPSDENYTALAAGTMAHQTGNTQTAENPVQQIGDLVGNAGGTWRTYEQSMNGPCDLGSQDTYTIDDTPFHNFKDVADNQAVCQEHEQPLEQMAVDLKSPATTPQFSWFSANDCYDMEGCGIAAGDAWLSETLPEIFNSPAWTQQRSLLIITWDEDAADGQANLQNIPTLILGSQGTVKAGSVSAHRYTLYSLLRTTEAALNLPSLTANDYYADPVNDIWTGQ